MALWKHEQCGHAATVESDDIDAALWQRVASSSVGGTYEATSSYKVMLSGALATIGLIMGHPLENYQHLTTSIFAVAFTGIGVFLLLFLSAEILGGTLALDARFHAICSMLRWILILSLLVLESYYVARLVFPLLHSGRQFDDRRAPESTRNEFLGFMLGFTSIFGAFWDSAR